MSKYPYLIPLLLCWIHVTSTADITSFAFGSLTNEFPAAFGDFNSDELTDLFVIDMDERTVRILIACPNKPYFEYKGDGYKCVLPPDYKVTSVVPGDFDGDALMDFLVTAMYIGNEDKDKSMTYVFINWGNLTSVICSREYQFQMIGEPLVIDHNQDLITDLFGRKNDTTNVFWIFSQNRSEPIREIPLKMPVNMNIVMRKTHSHAFVDVNSDNAPDLFLTTKQGFGVWLYDTTSTDFVFDYMLRYPKNRSTHTIGQNLFMDLETAGSLQVIVPVCEGYGDNCKNSAIYVNVNDAWVNLNVSFNDNSNRTWNFIGGDGRAYTDTLTLRPGDFNNDGYVDLLATLAMGELRRTFLLENVQGCGSCGLQRTFRVKWDDFGEANANTVAGAFYDFLQDGILDVIFVRPTADQRYQMSAFQNDIDYDANFVKVMVISGLKNSASSAADSASSAAAALFTPKPTFGTSLPGPQVRYKTTNQDGNQRVGVAVQLPQSAHFALYLPYTIFGLGRTPNFVEDLAIGTFNQSRCWTQIIPNSQMVVIPYPQDKPWQWRAQLFVTPSKIVLQTVAALAGTCVFIALIIALLHWKERREDRIEKLLEAHRFHFDAM